MRQVLRYVIELGGSAAGVVVQDNQNFRFFASDRRYGALERRLFRSPRHAEESCKRLQASGDRLCRAA